MEVFKDRMVDACLSVFQKGLRAKKTPYGDIVELSNLKRIALINQESFVIPRVSVFFSNRCTLKCKECAALIPHYESMIDLDHQEVLESTELILESVDECMSIDLVTGEMITHPYLPSILRYYINHPKVKMVEIFTNGTTRPHEAVLPLLRSDKVLVELSDYGDISTTANALSFYEKHSVKTAFFYNTNWIPMGDMKKRGQGIDELELQFSKCYPSRTCKCLYDKRLYHCVTAASICNIFPEKASCNDHIEIRSSDPISVRRKLIYDFFTRTYSPVCDYCNFGTEDVERVLPAEQIGKERPFFSEYTFIKRSDYMNLTKKNPLQK